MARPWQFRAAASWAELIPEDYCKNLHAKSVSESAKPTCDVAKHKAALAKSARPAPRPPVLASPRRCRGCQVRRGRGSGGGGADPAAPRRALAVMYARSTTMVLFTLGCRAGAFVSNALPRRVAAGRSIRKPA